jgi:hypothetical protein
VARAWKDSLRMVRRTGDGAGERAAVTTPRKNFKDELLSIRAFYLDISR